MKLHGVSRWRRKSVKITSNIQIFRPPGRRPGGRPGDLFGGPRNLGPNSPRGEKLIDFRVPGESPEAHVLRVQAESRWTHPAWKAPVGKYQEENVGRWKTPRDPEGLLRFFALTEVGVRALVRSGIVGATGLRRIPP